MDSLEKSESIFVEMEEKKFITSITERVIAVLMLPLSYIYCSMFFVDEPTWNILFLIFVIGLIVMGEVLFHDRKRSVESWYYMSATLVLAGCTVFGNCDVWNKYFVAFFAHLFGVYWVLVRADRLSENETSHLFVWDGLNGFILVPFNNLILFFSTVKSIFAGKKKIDQNKLWAGIVSSILGIILLVIAVFFLRNSDANYDHFITAVGVSFNFDGIFILKLILSVAMCTYLYALMGGCKRSTRSAIDTSASKINQTLISIAKVPSIVWIVFIGLFSAFYVCYFVIQGSYLFDAFRMYLPLGFTYSEYARKGFSDMCAVMIINLIVLWLANRIVDNRNGGIKIVSTLLDIESMIFAVIAFLKLYMYIYEYGFTPLRLQSLWLVGVLFLACVGILVSMHFKKKTAKIWFSISSAALVVLCIV